MADENNNGIPDEQEQSLAGINDILKQVIGSTIEAENDAADKYLQNLERYAWGKSANTDNKMVEMVEFSVQNESGHPQRVTIPKIVLMPIPMLHIKEATFEMEVESNIEMDKTVNGKGTSARITVRPATVVRRATPVPRPSSARARASQVAVLETPEVTQTENTENTEQQNKANMKICVKMEQSDMPSGVIALLQAITNNIKLKD